MELESLPFFQSHSLVQSSSFSCASLSPVTGGDLPGSPSTCYVYLPTTLTTAQLFPSLVWVLNPSYTNNHCIKHYSVQPWGPGFLTSPYLHDGMLLFPPLWKPFFSPKVISTLESPLVTLAFSAPGFLHTPLTRPISWTPYIPFHEWGCLVYWGA